MTSFEQVAGGTGAEPTDSLVVTPCFLTEAMRFVKLHHRHHLPPVGGLFAIGASRSGEMVGVAMVGRPVARMLQDGWTAEVTRLCTLEDGTGRHAGSMLYAACWRAAKAMGYKRLITYILGSEPGTTLLGAGWRNVGHRGGGSWSVPSRPRVDKHPLEQKTLWEMTP